MIRVLSKNVADKIAAGEVVDRPVSIVKELFENAVDAGAGSITVEIKDGGKTYIRVTDDGCGIDRSEVQTAFLRHATSKIKSADDLARVMTLGFRGEALASIAAVSRTEMITKTAGDCAGVSIRIEGGEVVSMSDIGCQDGTSVIVTDLFYNTPARLKFMKSDGVEATRIVGLISKMALAYAGIKIRMISNGSILFSTSGKSSVRANITEIFGKETGERLIQYYAGEDCGGECDIQVFVSPQSLTKPNKKYQIFFINGRYVQSKLIENAISSAYREKIPDGRYPVVFLFYYANPSALDVNIHPNKKEVRFADEKAVFDLISRTISRAVDTTQMIPDIKNLKTDEGGQDQKAEDGARLLIDADEKRGADHAGASSDEDKKSSADSDHGISKAGISSFFAREREEIENDKRQQSPVACERQTDTSGGANKTAFSNEQTQKGQTEGDMRARGDEDGFDGGRSYTEHQTFLLAETESDYESEARKSEPYISNIQVTGAIFDTYITGYDAKYFYLIDQHAAHERVFYEQLLESQNNLEKGKQVIMTPILLEVPKVLNESESKITDYLKERGFDIEPFGEKTYKIGSVPAYMGIREAEEFLIDFMDNVGENTDFEDKKALEKIIAGACKKAVKANDKLDISEIKGLLSDLARTKNPYSCPHGRPVFLKLQKQEIEKMFKRT